MKWLLLALTVAFAPAHADEALWQALRDGGQVLFVRHAQTTPGFGDPPGFKLEDCATQRNLSNEGRAQAQRMGAALRKRGVPIGEVLSSPWCRCMETAQLAFGGAKVWAPLANLHARHENAAKQIHALRPRIAAHKGERNLVLVAHGSVASALFGEHLAMGEILVLKPRPPGFDVVGRLALP
jgi:broad specificity phosphatase PhoE